MVRGYRGRGTWHGEMFWEGVRKRGGLGGGFAITEEMVKLGVTKILRLFAGITKSQGAV